MPELPPGLTVEFPVEGDERLHREVHRVLAAVVALGGAVGWTHVPEPEETAGWLEAELSLVASGRGGLAAVRRDGVLEALGVWGRLPGAVVAHVAEVRKVMVHPGARGHGLARIVVLALEEHARDHGIEVAVLDARGNNHAAHALYESLGWVEYGRVPDYVAIGNERWDRVCFYKRLQTPDGVIRHGSSPEGPGASNRR